MQPKSLLSPRTLVLLLASGLLLTGIAFATNVDPSSPDCDPYKPCPTCDGPSQVPKDDSCPSSFNYSLAIGYAQISRAGNFLNYSRTGFTEGQGGKSLIRSFDDVRKSILNTSNYQNTEMLHLTIVQDRIDSKLYNPSVFDLLPLPGVEIIKSGSTIRQVLTQSAFNDIEVLQDGFVVRTWNIAALTNRTKVNNFYVFPSSSPIKTTKFTNPDFPNQNNRLVISVTEDFSGNGIRSQTKLYNQTNPDLLTVETFEGPNLTGQLMERLTMNYSARGARPWDYSFERKIEQASNTNGAIGGLIKILHNFETYKDFSISAAGGDQNGKRLVSKTIAYGTPQAQTTTFDYYLDQANPYVNGRLKSLKNPDGSWEFWEYTDSKTAQAATETKYSSWKDVPFTSYQNGVKEVTNITNNETVRTVTIQGQQIAKEKFLTAVDPTSKRITYTESKWDGNAWADESTLYESSSSSTPAKARPIWRTFADGTAETIAYAMIGNQLQISVSKGDNSTGTATQPVITKGTKTVTLYNIENMEVSTDVYDIETNLQITMKTGTEFDKTGRATKTIFNANPNDFEITRYGCCGLEFSQDRSGATATYFRDNLKRVHRVINKSATTDTAITTVTAYNGLNTRVTRTDGTITLLVSDTTETLDGLTTTRLSPDADGDGNPETTTQVTVHNAATGPIVTTTHPDTTTTSSQDFLDGSRKSTTDQAAHTTTYQKETHNLNGGGIMMQTTAANGTQWQKTYSDHLDRTFRTEFAGGAFSSATYYPFTAAKGSRGKIASATDPDAITVTYEYNAEGEQTTTTRPMPANQQQISVVESDVVNDPDIGTALRSTRTVNGIPISTSLRSGDGYSSKSINHLAGNSKSTSTRTVPVDGAWTVTSIAPDETYTVSTTTKGLTSKQESFGSNNVSITSSEMTYDDFDRVKTTIDSRTGTTTMGTYLESGALNSYTAPGNRTTAFTYDKMGRTLTVDAPDTTDAQGNNLANITHTSYTVRGETAGNWGAQTNPTFRIYDSLGRMEELRTYQTLAPGTEPTLATTGFAKTNWIYSPTRGFLTGKRDATNKGTDYTHTDAGRVLTRTWARSTVASPQITTYGYDAGMMTSTEYSDTTPDVVTSYDNFGRTVTVKNGVGTLVSGVFTIATPLSSSTFAYDPTTLVVDTETITYDIDTNGTPELTRVIDRKQDSLLRDKGFDLKNGITIENAATYTYGLTDGRLHQISNPQIPGQLFTYQYVTNSNLIDALVGPIHTVDNIWESNRDLLDIKENKLVSTVISAYDYAVNAIGQRTGVTTSGTAFPAMPTWLWGYDSLGQVTSADNSVNTSDRAYEYDSISNRKKSANSLTLPTSDNYTANALNQYSSLSIPDPQSPISNPSYDADGNATAYPLPAAPTANSTLVWDAENRLTEVKNSTGSTIEKNIYDSGSRKIATTVNGVTTLYLYDAWNCIAEYEGGTGVSPVLKKTRLWGMDLSGSMQGAGGVGGLLSESHISNPQSPIYYPTYDGNGNVSEMLDSSGQVSAHFEYDPFGNTVVNTDTNNQFAYRFSTKPLDQVTGLYYYGYRYYDPVTGRWPSRDPIEEMGGFNLYGFVGNDGVNERDYLGQQEDPIDGGKCASCCKTCERTGEFPVLKDNGTNGWNLKLQITSPTFKSICDNESTCSSNCCFVKFNWWNCYDKHCGRSSGGHTYDITQAAAPGTEAWGAINVSIEGYTWCRCEKGTWVCREIGEHLFESFIIYEVDDRTKPTKWVESKKKQKAKK